MKRKTMFFVVGSVFLLFLSCKKGNSSPERRTIRYEVKGVGGANMFYSDNEYDIYGVSASLPWAKEFEVKELPFTASLLVTSTQGRPTSRIIVDGTLVEESTMEVGSFSDTLTVEVR